MWSYILRYVVKKSMIALTLLSLVVLALIITQAQALSNDLVAETSVVLQDDEFLIMIVFREPPPALKSLDAKLILNLSSDKGQLRLKILRALGKSYLTMQEFSINTTKSLSDSVYREASFIKYELGHEVLINLTIGIDVNVKEVYVSKGYLMGMLSKLFNASDVLKTIKYLNDCIELKSGEVREVDDYIYINYSIVLKKECLSKITKYPALGVEYINESLRQRIVIEKDILNDAISTEFVSKDLINYVNLLLRDLSSVVGISGREVSLAINASTSVGLADFIDVELSYGGGNRSLVNKIVIHKFIGENLSSSWNSLRDDIIRFFKGLGVELFNVTDLMIRSREGYRLMHDSKYYESLSFTNLTLSQLCDLISSTDVVKPPKTTTTSITTSTIAPTTPPKPMDIWSRLKILILIALIITLLVVVYLTIIMRRE